MKRLSRPALGAGLALGALVLVCTGGRGLPAGPISNPSAVVEGNARNSAEHFSETLKQAGRQLAVIAARTTPAVVNIESTHEGRSGAVEETGSGVLMKSPRTKGVFVITNRHVVSDARLSQIEILLHDGRVITPTEKLEDADSDLAVLRVPDLGIEPAQFGDSDNLEIGHFVLAMGSPFGLSQSVTLGIISAKGRRSLELPGRRVINQDFLQTDAAINPGNSGGPLIDLDGRVIGINTAIASQGGGNEGIGFSIPSNLVQFVVGQLLDHGRVRRGYLGVELDEHFDIDAARRYSLDRKYGARVTRVFEKTPASQAGLRPDDIILNFDGIDVQDETDLINRVSLTPVNQRVRMIILRKGRKETLQVILAEKPDQRSQLPDVPALPLPAEGRVYRNTGFSVFQLSDALAVQSGFARNQTGLLVSHVTSQDRAEQNLHVYDVIEEVARRPVETPEDLDAVLADHADEETLLLKVRRIVDGRTESRLVLWQRPRSGKEDIIPEQVKARP